MRGRYNALYIPPPAAPPTEGPGSWGFITLGFLLSVILALT